VETPKRYLPILSAIAQVPPLVFRLSRVPGGYQAQKTRKAERVLSGTLRSSTHSSLWEDEREGDQLCLPEKSMNLVYISCGTGVNGHMI
jgi:hypothetical protein